MNGKRLALVAFAAGLIIAVTGGPSNSTGQTQDGPGITYGGTKDIESAWLRLDSGRRAIAAIEMQWAVASERCSNRKTYFSALYAGYEWQDPIIVSQAGKFRKTVIDRYRDRGSRYEEHQVVSGTIDGPVARGSISGRVRVVKPNGQVVRCNFGPQRWRLRD
jgi:hypothetical protein